MKQLLSYFSLFKQSTWHRRSTLNGASGFTLIELLVSIALLGIIMGVGVSAFMMVQSSHKTSVTISKLQTQGSQMVEVLERAVRSSSQATVLAAGADGCLATVTNCLRLQISSGSLEYSLNGGCAYTFYAWTKPTDDTNGTLQRYARTDDITTSCGPGIYDVADTDAYTGISVESSSSPTLFSEMSVDGEVHSIRTTLQLAEGVALRPSSGDDTRSKVTFTSVVGLRQY